MRRSAVAYLDAVSRIVIRQQEAVASMGLGDNKQAMSKQQGCEDLFDRGIEHKGRHKAHPQRRVIVPIDCLIQSRHQVHHIAVLHHRSFGKAGAAGGVDDIGGVSNREAIHQLIFTLTGTRFVTQSAILFQKQYGGPAILQHEEPPSLRQSGIQGHITIARQQYPHNLHHNVHRAFRIYGHHPVAVHSVFSQMGDNNTSTSCQFSERYHAKLIRNRDSVWISVALPFKAGDDGLSGGKAQLGVVKCKQDFFSLLLIQNIKVAERPA